MGVIIHLSSGEQFEPSDSLERTMELIRQKGKDGYITYDMSNEDTGHVGTEIVYVKHIVKITNY